MSHFGFLSTYPPTRCGLATFTESLAGALAAGDSTATTIVRVRDFPGQDGDASPVAWDAPAANLIAADRASVRDAVTALDSCDVAIIQHEYGIYGGYDGDEIVPLIQHLAVPSIIVLHTVLAAPSAHQRAVLESVCAAASTVVVMTASAKRILLAGYRVAESKVQVIPHGVPAHHALRLSQKIAKRVVTWGLISPGKGIEWGIRAMAILRVSLPQVEYVIAGQTHPKVVLHEGERYRQTLQRLIDDLDLADVVHLDDRYLDAWQLAELLATADAVLLPYDSRDQATSGVLVEATAAGVPVVATGFPHAVELLGGGAGLIARHEDPVSMAAALHTILSTDAAAKRMHDAALRDAHDLSWPMVAEAYREAALRATRARDLRGARAA